MATITFTEIRSDEVMCRTWKRDLIAVSWTLAVTYAVGRWAFHFAYLERGYKSVGGEYLLVLMVYWGAWKAINYLFDSLEELENERKRKRKKRRSSFYELNNTLLALEKQKYSDFEVIVANDGSNDVEKTLPAVTYKLKYLYLERCANSGRSYARNKAIECAEGELIIFLDCDQITENNFVSEHVKLYEYEKKGDILQFGTRKELLKKVQVDTEDIHNQTYYEDERTQIFQLCGYDTKHINALWALVYSHNLSIPKRLLMKFGGFDETFRGWGLEDVELAYRLKKNGVKLCFNPYIETYDQYNPKMIDEKEILVQWKFNYDMFLAKHCEIDVKLLDVFLNYFDPSKRVMLNERGIEYTWMWCFTMFEKMIRELNNKEAYVFPLNYMKKDIIKLIEPEEYYKKYC